MTLSTPITRTSEGKPRAAKGGFPFLTHRTCAEIYGPQLEGLRQRRIAQRRNG